MLTVKIEKTDFKDPNKWQEIAKSLELPDDRVAAIVMRIPGLLPVKPGLKVPTEVPQPSKWLWADDADGAHSYIIHTRSPRFIAEIASDDELHPPFEYVLEGGEMLCNFNWIDQPPEDLTALLNEAVNFIHEYDQNSGVDNESSKN
ncbi:MAG TPA: hypothetical protein HPP51_00850 [Planctomycetes bacterium]|nr:hypothetical protein [Planctomycetota bacterium]